MDRDVRPVLWEPNWTDFCKALTYINKNKRSTYEYSHEAVQGGSLVLVVGNGPPQSTGPLFTGKMFSPQLLSLRLATHSTYKKPCSSLLSSLLLLALAEAATLLCFFQEISWVRFVVQCDFVVSLDSWLPRNTFLFRTIPLALGIFSPRSFNTPKVWL